MSSLAETALGMGLPKLAKILAAANLPVAAPADAALTAPAATGLPAFDQMRRRGLDLSLVKDVLAWFGDRPIEKGLVAWDVLNSSLVAEPLLSELRSLAAEARDILPPAGFAGARLDKSSIVTLLDALAAPVAKLTDQQLAEQVAMHLHLGALRALALRLGTSFLEASEVFSSTAHFARRLHLAGLSTLASVYQRALWQPCGQLHAGLDLVETLLDVGATGALPSMAELAALVPLPEGPDLLSYQGLRRQAIEGKATAFSESVAAPLRDRDWTKLSLEEEAVLGRSVFAWAELASQRDRFPVPIQTLVRMAQRMPEWRFGQRMLVVAAAGVNRGEDEAVLAAIDRFVYTYGDQFQLWFGLSFAAKNAPAVASGVLSRLVRECTNLPHNSNAWLGLCQLLNAEAGFQEIDARLRSQATL